MESIDKLREWLNYKCIRYDSVNNAIELANGHHPDELYEIADEIEREIEDKIDDLMATSVDGYPKPFNTPDAMHMVLGTAADCFDTPQEAVHYLRGETSMLLPVDADGVPWHIGEEIKLPYGNRDKVRFMTIRERDVVVNERGWVADQCRHVKPRTIEDVLAEFFHESRNSYTSEKFDLVDKYSDELRSMGVGE